MTSAAFDTLKLSRRLEEAGFTHEQATGLADALNDTLGDVLVTRDYLDTRLDALESRITANILKWMFGALAAQAAIIVALIKLL